jgi:hypothetical protein
MQTWTQAVLWILSMIFCYANLIFATKVRDSFFDYLYSSTSKSYSFLRQSQWWSYSSQVIISSYSYLKPAKFEIGGPGHWKFSDPNPVVSGTDPTGSKRTPEQHRKKRTFEKYLKMKQGKEEKDTYMYGVLVICTI